MDKLRGKVRVVKGGIEGVQIRYGTEEDGKYWAEWLKDPVVQGYFPMLGEEENAQSVQRMQLHTRYRSVLVAEVDGEVAGVAYINLSPFRKLAHQGLFTLIVSQKHRGKGVGTKLMEQLHKLAKEGFGLEMLHLEVYEGNPAIRLYRRLGYRECGFQSHWIKLPSGEYRGKIFMDKWL